MRSTWKASLLLTAMFAVGALAGGTAVGLAKRHELPGYRRGQHHHTGDHIEFLTRELSLSPPQRDSVQAILERYRPKMDSIWQQLGPRFETIRDSISNEIRRQLAPEQQATYTEMIRRFEAERRRPSD